MLKFCLNDPYLEEECADQNIKSAPEQLFYSWWSITPHKPEIGLLAQYQIGQYRVDFVVDTLTYFVNSDQRYSVEKLI
ncbi:hypothetical protein LCGC14_2928610, partial [marine sediment metagenome]